MTDVAAAETPTTIAGAESVHAGVAKPVAPGPSAEWGDPLALGLASFGISALVLAAINSGWIDATPTLVVLCLAIALGFGTEIVVGVIHFKRW